MRYIDKALPILLMVLTSMGAGALAILSTDFFRPYEYETSEANYYQAECYRIELTRPDFATPKYRNSPEGRSAQVEWNKNRPPYCDLAAQFEASNSARSSSQYTAWTLILTFAGVVLLSMTLAATRRTLDEAERTTKAILDEQRPWLSIENIEITRFTDHGPQAAPDDPSINSLRYNFLISANLKNSGKMPAHNAVVRIYCGPTLQYSDALSDQATSLHRDNGRSLIFTGQSVLCDEFVSWDAAAGFGHSSESGLGIHPDGSVQISAAGNFGSTAEVSLAQLCNGWSAAIGVKYRVNSGGAWAYTIRAFRISRRNPEPHRPSPTNGWPDNLTVDNIVLEPFFDRVS